MNSRLDAHFSHARPDWATPRAFFERQNAKHGPFDLDVCARADNAKCDAYISPALDGLKRPWRGRCWCNPPYGPEIRQWLEKALEETRNGNADLVACLLPARTDTKWWHEIVQPHAAEIEFIKGRIRFEGATSGAPFPSVMVIFKKPQPARS